MNSTLQNSNRLQVKQVSTLVVFLGLILALNGAISCVAVKTGLQTFIGTEGAILLAYEQSSPFYAVPGKGLGDIEFHVDFTGSWKDGLYDVDMFYSLNPSELIFLKTDRKLISEFVIRLECYDNTEDLVFYKEWEEVITADDYKSTKVNRSIIKSNAFELEPGKYKIISVFRDKNSNIATKVERKKVVIEPFKESDLLVSDIGFVDYRSNLFEKENLDSLIKNSENIQHANRSFKDSLRIYYEIYNNRDPVNIEYSVFDENGKQILPDSVRIDSIEDTKIVHFDISHFPDGLYALGIKADSDSLSTGISKQFLIYRIGLDLSSNFKETIRLINYYINFEGDSLKKLKKSKSGKERLEAWGEFWKQFDPIPNTEKNEYFDEFARRVNFANHYFASQIRKGSYTDMGQVYICLGPPDDIYYRYLPQEGKAYEIWEYYRTFVSTPLRIFLFYDMIGLDIKGDYRLVNPIDSPRWFEY